MLMLMLVTVSSFLLQSLLMLLQTQYDCWYHSVSVLGGNMIRPLQEYYSFCCCSFSDYILDRVGEPLVNNVAVTHTLCVLGVFRSKGDNSMK